LQYISGFTNLKEVLAPRLRTKAEEEMEYTGIFHISAMFFMISILLNLGYAAKIDT